MKKVIFDDSCQFCTGAVNRVFNDEYQLVGISQLNQEDKNKVSHLDLSMEIVMIDEDGSIKRNIDVFMDTKEQNSKLHRLAQFGLVHYALRQAYKIIAAIRYRLK